ncbi:MAG: hypothetical protein U9532_03580 ['Conium maculatum' witches'-broom phytoplasma]|nr:hypothetical protein ['Conium maculatum' witches'-broom phytoplasma]
MASQSKNNNKKIVAAIILFLNLIVFIFLIWYFYSSDPHPQSIAIKKTPLKEDENYYEPKPQNLDEYMQALEKWHKQCLIKADTYYSREEILKKLGGDEKGKTNKITLL